MAAKHEVRLSCQQVVEVSAYRGNGTPYGWRRAAVVTNSNAEEVQIEYLEVGDVRCDDTQEETMERSSVRPAPPLELCHFKSLHHAKIGHSVEAFLGGIWMAGIVASVGASGVHVKLLEGFGAMDVADPHQLRPSMTLQGQSWHRVVPDRKELQELGLSRDDAQAVVKTLSCQPPVSVGPTRFVKGYAGAADGARAGDRRKRQRHDGSGVEEASSEGGDASEREQSEELEGDEQPDQKGSKEAEGSGNDGEADDGDGEEDEIEEQEDEDEAGYQKQDEERRKRSAGGGPSTAVAPTASGARAPRPRRAIKQRVVYLRGVPVLKENMYGLHDEDTMVWQRDLKAGQANMEGIEVEPKRRSGRPQRTPVPDKKPHVHPPELEARLQHNHTIRQDTQESEAARAKYLLQHLDKLEPFIKPQVAARIRAAAITPKSPAKKRPPVLEQPEQILATLREYQLEGLSWLVSMYDHGVNAILGDEMGMGKTLQTITFLAYLKFVRGVGGPHLVVVPLSVLTNWLSELKKWCPSMRAVRLHSTSPEERKRLVQEILSKPSSFDVAVTTYEMVNAQNFGHCLKHMVVWRYVVMDEAHRVKNEDSLTFHGVRLISRQYVLMLTGTPIQNNLRELYSLLHFLYPDVFTDPTIFDEAFDLTRRKVDAHRLDSAHHLLRPFMLRRLKEEVEVSLPPKLETRIQCPLAEMQTFWYRRLLLKEGRLLAKMEGGAQKDNVQTEGNSWKRAQNLLMQLRKVCNHPFMFKEAEVEGMDPEELVRASGKMMVLDRLLSKLKDRGHRVVLFSQFTHTLDILEDYMNLRNYNFRRLDGGTNRIKRMLDIQEFNKPGSKIFIYLLATRAGGLGVNLQTADTCILFDSDWNPQWDLQAMARVHRIGQTRPVHAYRLVTEGTVEDRIQRRAESKLYLDQMINRGSTSNAEQLERMDHREVLAMLKFGADRIFRNDKGQMPSEEELGQILDRSRMLAEREAAAQGQATAAGGAKQQPPPPTSGGAGAAAAAAGESAGPTEATQPGGRGRGSHDGDEGRTGSGSGITASGSKSDSDTQIGSQRASGDSPKPKGDGAQADDGGSGSEGSSERSGAADPKPQSSSGGSESSSGDSAIGTGGGKGGSAGPSGSRPPPPPQPGDPAGGPAADGAKLIEAKHTAAEFDAEAAPVNTFSFMGLDFKALRAAAENASLKDIARQYWEGKKRERRQRLMDIDGFKVLRANNYTMEEGMLHSPGQVRGKKEEEPDTRRKLQKAGVDYENGDYCLICWSGGDLICCDRCPAAYHRQCLGMSDTEATGTKKWTCPQHRCATCDRTTDKAGGFLLRCEVCPRAFCEDDVPPDHEMVGECELYKALGQTHPTNACFIHCSKSCSDWAVQLKPLIQSEIQRLENGEAAQNSPAGSGRAGSEADESAEEKVSEHASPASERGGGRGRRATDAGRGRGRARGRGRGAKSSTGGRGAAASPGRGREQKSGKRKAVSPQAPAKKKAKTQR